MHCTCHRVFLATLIVAAKYLNDQSPKNKHWSAHSAVFSVGEVNLMEKQLLSLLDFDLRITEADLASSLQDFLELQQATSSSVSAKGTTIPSGTTSTLDAHARSHGSRYTSSVPAPKTNLVPSPSSSYIPQTVPVNQPSSNKRASASREDRAEIRVVVPPHDQFKRRPSLPNQPCLEEGEVMPMYKIPIRNNQDQYPSPDSGPDSMNESSDTVATGTAVAVAPKSHLVHLPSVPAPVVMSRQQLVSSGYVNQSDNMVSGHGYKLSRAMC
ncbi:hypothetical protein BCR41DRAFT_345879, partial [Lobosporangium transversale]